MLKVHITKVNNKVLMPVRDFERLLHEAEKSNPVTVETDEFQDLVEASSTGLDFWNNDIDDKIWNNA
jgi:hypothetical protein